MCATGVRWMTCTEGACQGRSSTGITRLALPPAGGNPLLCRRWQLHESAARGEKSPPAHLLIGGAAGIDIDGRQVVGAARAGDGGKTGGMGQQPMEAQEERQKKKDYNLGSRLRDPARY